MSSSKSYMSTLLERAQQSLTGNNNNSETDRNSSSGRNRSRRRRSNSDSSNRRRRSRSSSRNRRSSSSGVRTGRSRTTTTRQNDSSSDEEDGRSYNRHTGTTESATRNISKSSVMSSRSRPKKGKLRQIINWRMTVTVGNKTTKHLWIRRHITNRILHRSRRHFVLCNV